MLTVCGYHSGAVKPVIAIFILLFIAVAQSRAEQLPIRTYTTAEGLARDQVYKIVTDPRGFLWFCTTDGLSRRACHIVSSTTF